MVQHSVKFFAKKTIFIEIARPAHYLIKNCGDFSETVRKYNDILRKNNDQFLFLPIYEGKPSGEFMLPDGYHLNLKGHQIANQRIQKIIYNL